MGSIFAPSQNHVDFCYANNKMRASQPSPEIPRTSSIPVNADLTQSVGTMKPDDPEFKLHLLSIMKSFAKTLRGVRYQSSVENISHSAIVSNSTYSPWLDDREFDRIWRQVSENSLVDIYRMHQLWSLTGQVCGDRNLNGDILEVGSWRGGSGCLIASRCATGNPGLRVFLADTFCGVAKAGVNDTLYRGGEHRDTTPELVMKLVNGLELSNVEVLQGLFPEETAHLLAKREFRFCHIDVDAYQSARDVFEWVWPRLCNGGVVVFDDYGFWGCEGITKLVNENSTANDRLFIHNLSGQAIIVKRDAGKPDA